MNVTLDLIAHALISTVSESTFLCISVHMFVILESCSHWKWKVPDLQICTVRNVKMQQRGAWNGGLVSKSLGLKPLDKNGHLTLVVAGATPLQGFQKYKLEFGFLGTQSGSAVAIFGKYCTILCTLLEQVSCNGLPFSFRYVIYSRFTFNTESALIVEGNWECCVWSERIKVVGPGFLHS